jgi:hypothetical protein
LKILRSVRVGLFASPLIQRLENTVSNEKDARAWARTSAIASAIKGSCVHDTLLVNFIDVDIDIIRTMSIGSDVDKRNATVNHCVGTHTTLIAMLANTAG